MKKLLFLILIFSSAIRMSGAHIIGGDVTYQCINIDSANMETTYEIIMSVYRDSKGGGAQLDPVAKIGIFEGEGLFWDFILQRNVPVQDVEDITTNDDPCIIIPPTIGVEKGIYKFTITLPWSDKIYKIAYQRCCRNNTISNLVSPGETGAAFSVDIMPEAQTSCNNSPTFDDFPPIIICADVLMDIDQSATDIDGDQLVYEFCIPKKAGFTDGATTVGDPNSCTGVTPDPNRCPPPFQEVDFLLPTFSFNAPLGASANMDINSNTGQITGRPLVLGQYVVGVCVKEFRNGQLIGEIRRDFQFNVSFCEIAVQAALETDNPKASVEELPGKEFNIKSCGPTEVAMINLSQEEANIDAYLWEMDINGQIVTVDTKDATFQFPGLGTYYGQMILNPAATSCSDTANLTVNILPGITSNFEFDYDTCVAGPVDFTDLSITGAMNITDWRWEFGDGNSDVNQFPSHQYQTPGDKPVKLVVTDDNQCVDSITQIISWNPVPDVVVIEPSQFIGCKPSAIFFNNLSTPIDETYDIVWTFGDGNTSGDISPTNTFEEAGLFDVFLEITSPEGCYTSRSYPQLIEIKDKPSAEFTYSPEEPSSFRKEVFFTDFSTDAISWTWNFSNIGAAFEPNPSFEFPDTGIYKIDLIVVHPEGCTDTTTQFIDVKPLITLHIPTAFSPNNDGLNDTFKGKGVTEGITEYNLKIWNRWGATVFQTNDPNIGWNGEMNNSGDLAQQGVYVYTLTYRGPRGEIKTKKGHITLIR
jgi:gliding motility-associated-like protein